MHELQFINAMSDKHIIKALADDIVNHGKCLHRIDVEEAHARQIGREAAREHRKLRFEKALDTALLVATIAGTAVVTAFFCGLAAC
jgi:hypothetical protein